MDIYKLTIAGISVAEGINRFSGDYSLYEKYLNKFPQDENFQKLENALKNGNAKEAFIHCHALKGLAGNLSIKNLYDTVDLLTEVLRVGSLDNTDELFDKVKTEYNNIVSAILEQ